MIGEIVASRCNSVALAEISRNMFTSRAFREKSSARGNF